MRYDKNLPPSFFPLLHFSCAFSFPSSLDPPSFLGYHASRLFSFSLGSFRFNERGARKLPICLHAAVRSQRALNRPELEIDWFHVVTDGWRRVDMSLDMKSHVFVPLASFKFTAQRAIAGSIPESWSCRHMPSFTYNRKVPITLQTRRQGSWSSVTLCWFWGFSSSIHLAGSGELHVGVPGA